MPEENLYEIVPMDPIDKMKSKGTELEKEIDAIKNILKETVKVSKMKTSADEMVDKIIEMLKVSQDMVGAVSKSNQELSQQLQKSLDSMTESNKELSQKMDMLLDFFAEAAETPAESEAHPEVESAVVDKLDKLISSLDSKLDTVIASNAKVAEQMPLPKAAPSMPRQAPMKLAPSTPAAPGLPPAAPAAPASVPPAAPGMPRPLPPPPSLKKPGESK